MNKSKNLLTEKQKLLLIFMAEFKHEYGIMPTQQQMAAHFGVTMSAINAKLESIGRRGIKI